MKSLLERVLGRPARDERERRSREPEGEAAPEEEAPADSGEALAPGMSRASVIEALRHQVALGSGGRFRAQEIDEAAQLFDRGYLDSFSYVEFLAFIEHTYRVRIEDSHLAGHLSTIEAMAAHIVQAQVSSAE